MDDPMQFVTEDLPRILETLRGSDVRDLELADGDVQLRIRRATPVDATAVEEFATEETEPLSFGPDTVEVAAPIVGTFYSAAHPGDPPFVGEGSIVEDHTVVGIIEALHVLTEVEAGCRGQVATVLATDGQAVEYGQALFEVEPLG